MGNVRRPGHVLAAGLVAILVATACGGSTPPNVESTAAKPTGPAVSTGLSNVPFDPGLSPALAGGSVLFVVQDTANSPVRETGSAAWFDFESDTWARYSAPPSLVQPAAVVVDGGVIVIGLSCKGRDCHGADLVAAISHFDDKKWSTVIIRRNVEGETFSPVAIGSRGATGLFNLGKSAAAITLDGSLSVTDTIDDAWRMCLAEDGVVAVTSRPTRDPATGNGSDQPSAADLRASSAALSADGTLSRAWNPYTNTRGLPQAPADANAMVACGDNEILATTAAQTYSWNAQNARWVIRSAGPPPHSTAISSVALGGGKSAVQTDREVAVIGPAQAWSRRPIADVAPQGASVALVAASGHLLIYAHEANPTGTSRPGAFSEVQV